MATSTEYSDYIVMIIIFCINYMITASVLKGLTYIFTMLLTNGYRSLGMLEVNLFFFNTQNLDQVQCVRTKILRFV